jgi:hypothetical protein
MIPQDPYIRRLQYTLGKLGEAGPRARTAGAKAPRLGAGSMGMRPTRTHSGVKAFMIPQPRIRAALVIPAV